MTDETAVLPGAEEREMLRRSVRDLLAKSWPAAQAVARAQRADATAAIWTDFVAQGLAMLGIEPSEGGLSEIAIVMEELGRAACPAPFPGAVLANLIFAKRDKNPAAAALLERLHAGEARICLAFAADEPQAARFNCVDNRITGALRFVDAAKFATHLLVILPQSVAIIDCAAAGVTVMPIRALGGDTLCEVTLNNAPGETIALSPSRIADLRHVTRLMLTARAHGAARRAFELAVDYVKERHQFGQPIGRFQAVQHKLANGLIALEGVRLTLHHAAMSYDLRAKDWRYFSSAAVAFAGQTLRQVSLETHHAFGAIGYADEHEAPRHFKQVHLDCIAMGGATEARRELAAHMLDSDTAMLPDYDLGETGNAFRREVRCWLQLHWGGERKAAFDVEPFSKREFDPSFARDLGKTGWLGLGWPREYGGQARTPLEQLAFTEVMERAEAPRIGAAVQANALMMFGTNAQKSRYLPEILHGEAMHGMGYSEPNAGSDLAALRTTAVRDGDEWIIDGQKIWTTTYWGKYMFLAARTDRDATPPHKGISMFIVPMNTPGITVKPSTTMYDGRFANIFYDAVRVPLDALLGPLNGGWKVLTDALANERGVVGGGIVLKVAHAFGLLCGDVRATNEFEFSLRRDPMVRDRIGALAADIEVGRQLMIHCANLATCGTTPPEMGAISKVYSGELMERFGEAALDILGPQAALSQGAPGNMRNGRYEQNLRHSLMWVISIGTNEIQRSLIAQRGLGLPR